jgi:hypothetical protein
VDPSGELLKVEQATNSTGPGGSRRLLAVGTVGGGPPTLVSSGAATHSPLDSSDVDLRKKACQEWIDEAYRDYRKKVKRGNAGKTNRVLVFPPGMPTECRVLAMSRVALRG